MKMPSLLRPATDWFFKTPERALDQAYKAALKVKDIEDKHFQGKQVSSELSNYGKTTTSYFKAEVLGYLQQIRIKLFEFQASRLFLNLSEVSGVSLTEASQLSDQNGSYPANTILEKLNFIDQILQRYKTEKNFYDGNALENSISQKPTKRNAKKDSQSFSMEDKDKTESEKMTFDKTGVLPRSFLKTFNRIQQEINPKSAETEEQVIQKYRYSRYQTAISIKFILLLIIVPLLTHQITKTFLVSPLVAKYLESHPQIIFINQDLEEEAFQELQHYEETLLFKERLGLIPKLSEEERDVKLKERANEISENSRQQGANAIANIFADVLSLIAFGVVIVTNRQEIEVVKSFIDEILYGLSDSAKAFLIILFTDMFVGFHSPHGWEVILEGIARHFGLPENRDFNFLFIATFPVILDTVLKYWIFRYLNRISPSAVATYKNMNE